MNNPSRLTPRTASMSVHSGAAVTGWSRPRCLDRMTSRPLTANYQQGALVWQGDHRVPVAVDLGGPVRVAQRLPGSGVEPAQEFCGGRLLTVKAT